MENRISMYLKEGEDSEKLYSLGGYTELLLKTDEHLHNPPNNFYGSVTAFQSNRIYFIYFTNI